MTVAIVACLVAIVAFFTVTVFRLFTLNRAERLEYLKSYRKGKFAIIYIVAIPLFWIGITYRGVSHEGAVFLAVKATIELVMLRFDYNTVQLLMTENVLYHVTMWVCFVATALNVVLFTLTVTGVRISNYFRKVKAVTFSKKVFVVVGYNEQNVDIIKSIKSDGDVFLITERKDAQDLAYVNKASLITVSSNSDVGEIIKKTFRDPHNKAINVIVNTGDDVKNLVIVGQIAGIMEDSIGEDFIDITLGYNCYVFGEPENTSAFLHFGEKTNGRIHYINKYKIIANDFVDRYPLTQFMTDEIDYDTATLKNEVDVNMVMVGFGKTNQEIFLTSIAANQFVAWEESELIAKQVNYFVYDKIDAHNDKNLNHSYLRYREDKYDKGKYLPLPKKPAHEVFFKMDVNDNDFYESVKKNILPKKGRTSYTYIVISFGEDLENIDLAEKFSAKLKEWHASERTKIFVRVSGDKLTKDVMDKEYAVEKNFITFGNEKEVVYSLPVIVGEKITKMAIDKHTCYSMEMADCGEEDKIMRMKALNKWYSQTRIQRESNIYACLSIRQKLHMLGYDYAPLVDEREDVTEEFSSAYQAGDPIISEGKSVSGRSNVLYTNDFILDSVRGTYAIQEHQRWNAYMISCGIVPSTIEQIRAGDSKNLTERRHGNITTFDGLVEYRRIVSEATGKSEEDTDVIRYDYQIMDDLTWILSKNNQKIVKKQPQKGE